MSRKTILISIIVYIIFPAIFLTYLNERDNRPKEEDSQTVEIKNSFNNFININKGKLAKSYGGELVGCFDSSKNETIILYDKPPYWVTFMFCTEPRINKTTPNIHELSFVSVDDWKVLLSDGHLFKSDNSLNDIPEIEVKIKNYFNGIEVIEYTKYITENIKN